MEENRNEYNENRQTNMSQGTNLFNPTRKERIKQKAKDVIKIITSVIAHQLKITFLIASISQVMRSCPFVTLSPAFTCASKCFPSNFTVSRPR